MTDEAIIQIAQESCKVLSGVPWHSECKYLLPSYNALLQAAKANHPEDPFISALPTIAPNGEEDSINPPQLNVLFAQLRIALESLQGEEGAHPHRNSESPEGKPSRLDDIENRLADVNAQMQAVAERMSRADLAPEEMQQLARDLNKLVQRQAELARRR